MQNICSLLIKKMTLNVTDFNNPQKNLEITKKLDNIAVDTTIKKLRL